MVVADELSWAQGWTGQTQRLLTLGGFYSPKSNVLVKAILDGTPVDEGPHEIFYPCQFLCKGPALLSASSLTVFKNRYFAYETEEKVDETTGLPETVRKKGYNRQTNKFYDIHTGYQNLDELKGLLAKFSERVLRKDVSDAPAKVYQTRYFALTPKQRAVYDRLRGEYIAELSTGEVSVANVLTRMLRLQMVARNYYPPARVGAVCPQCLGEVSEEDCPRCEGLGIVVETTALERIDTRSPAAEALKAEIETAHSRPAVVWARFRQDVTDCLAVFRELGLTAGRFDGTIGESEREAAY